jgi:hypothetical protein
MTAHCHRDPGMNRQHYENTTYIIATMFFFSTMLTLSELMTRNTRHLRQHEKHIRELTIPARPLWA